MPTPVVYNQLKLKQNNGNAVDLDTATIRVMILSSSHVISQTDAFISDVSADEVSGTNYTAEGEAIAGVTLALDGNTVEWIHNDIVWTSSGAGFSNGQFFVWYEDTGTPSTSKLIMYMDNTTSFGNTSGDLTLDGSATTGVLNVT